MNYDKNIDEEKQLINNNQEEKLLTENKTINNNSNLNQKEGLENTEEIKTKKKRKIRLNSEAFPKTKDGHNQKLTPLSTIHKALLDHKIDKNLVIFRGLRKDDIPELMNLHKEWFPVEYTTNFFENLFNNNPKILIAAVYNIEETEYIIGTIVVEFHKTIKFKNYVPYTFHNLAWHENIAVFNENFEYAYISTFGVIDEFRKYGIGTKLLNFVLNALKYKENCLAVYLHVIEHNTAAIRFYEKNNFVKCNRIKNYYHLDDEVYNAFVFVKFLNYNERTENKKLYKKVLDLSFIYTLKLIIFIITFFWFGSGFRTNKYKYKLD